MKNIDIIRDAAKAAGITEEHHTFAFWKKNGFSVKKGEKAAFSADIWKKDGRRWKQTPAYFFTRSQVLSPEEKAALQAMKEKEAVPEVKAIIEKAAEEVTEAAPEVKAPALPEPEEITESDAFRIDNECFRMTACGGSVKAAFITKAICELNDNDFRRFVKYYVNDADDKRSLTAFLMEVLPAKKKVILSGKKANNAEVKKALNTIAKAAKKTGRKVLFQEKDGKYYFTDSRFIIECKAEDAESYLEAVPAFRENMEKHERLAALLEDIAKKEVTGSIDFSKVLTSESGKEKVYMFADKAAVKKEYVDCFKNKTFNVTSEKQPLFQTTEAYRAAVCPIKIF